MLQGNDTLVTEHFCVNYVLLFTATFGQLSSTRNVYISGVGTVAAVAALAALHFLGRKLIIHKLHAIIS